MLNFPVEKATLDDFPFYHRNGACKGSTYVRFGEVKRGGNEPYCYAQEKQCAGHICRVLSPGCAIDSACVVRDDGTIWTVWFPAFKDIHLLELTTG